MAKGSGVPNDIQFAENGLGDKQFEYNVRHSGAKAHTVG